MTKKLNKHYSKRVYPLIVYFLIFFSSTNCKSVDCKCNDHEPWSSKTSDSCAWKVTSYDIRYVASILKYWKIDNKFKPGFIRKEQQCYYTYLSNNHLVFISIFDSSKIYIKDFHFLDTRKSYYLTHFIHDTIHIVDQNEKQYFQFFVNDDFRIEKILSVDLNSIVNIKNWYVRVNSVGNQLGYNHPYIYLPYGLLNGRNYLDKEALLCIDLNSKAIKKVIAYPECFANCDLHLESTMPEVRESFIYGVFSYYNGYIKQNIVSNDLILRALPGGVGVKEFDSRKKEDLSYSRAYQVKNERNVSFVFLQTGNYIIIKKLFKQNLNDEDHYNCYYYKKNDNLICIKRINEAISSAEICQYQTGFIVFDKSFSNLYYYEFNN